MILIFEYSSTFCFLLIEIDYTFSNSYIVLTCKNSPVYFISIMHLYSWYYYYDNVVNGVLRQVFLQLRAWVSSVFGIKDTLLLFNPSGLHSQTPRPGVVERLG